MATFILIGKYTVEAVKEISASRTKKATGIIENNSGKILSAFVTMGENDLYLALQFPGMNEALKTSVELTKATGIAFITLPAVSLEEFDRLMGV